MDVNEDKGLSNITFRQKLVKEQVVIGNDIDVNEHKTLSKGTLRKKLK
jgi:hypothetical protein